MSYNNSFPTNADLLAECAEYPGVIHSTKLTIVVEGKQITHYQHFHLHQSVKRHHSFTLTLSHDSLGPVQDHHMEDAQKLFGKRIFVMFTYKNISESPERYFVGVITNVTLSMKQNSFGNIVLKGYSPTILLDGAPHVQSFGGKQPDSLKFIADKVIKQGLGEFKYKIRVEPNYTCGLSYSCQHDETHYNYLARTAEAYGEQFFYDGTVLHFGKLPPGEKPINLTDGEDVTEMYTWMELKHVKRSLYGYNSNRHEKLSTGETQISHASSLAKKAYAISEKTFQTPSLAIAPIKASTHLDVKAAQNSANGSAAVEVFTCSGKTTVPFLYPGCLVDMNVRKRGSAKSSYLTRLMITEIDHSVDMLGKYVGSFEAIAADTGYLPAPDFDTPKARDQIATVVDNNDPEGQGRVQVRFDWQWNGNTTEWIRVMSPDAGSSEAVSKNRGFVAIPEIGDQVMVRFTFRHPDRPYVKGSMFHGKIAAGGGPGNNIKSWSSKSGHIIQLDDAGGITIKDKTGGNHIVLDGKDKVTITSSEILEFTNGEANIKLEGNKITMHADEIELGNLGGDASKIDIKGVYTTISGKNAMKVHSDTMVEISSKSTIDITAKTDLTISAENTTINGKVITNIKGGVVNLLGGESTPSKSDSKVDAGVKKPASAFGSTKMWEPAPAIQDATIVNRGRPEDKKPKAKEPKDGRPENIVLFVNGYRFKPIGEHLDSDNMVSKIDRNGYWEGIDEQFADRLKSGRVFYADGHHSIETSNHQTMLSFAHSWRTMYVQDTKIEPSIERKEFLRIAEQSAKNGGGGSYSALGLQQYIRTTNESRLNTKPNIAGFNERRKNGQKAGRALLADLTRFKLRALTNPNDNAIVTLDIVAHSMGYAYALGMIDILKGKIPLGRFYIIAPENAAAGDINLNDFEEVWQYGANLGEPNADPIHLQDGVAPQAPVKGLDKIKNPILEKMGRAFIPNGEPKGFLQSHSIGNYKWIFKQTSDKEGYVKPRK